MVRENMYVKSINNDLGGKDQAVQAGLVVRRKAVIASEIHPIIRRTVLQYHVDRCAPGARCHHRSCLLDRGGIRAHGARIVSIGTVILADLAIVSGILVVLVGHLFMNYGFFFFDKFNILIQFLCLSKKISWNITKKKIHNTINQTIIPYGMIGSDQSIQHTNIL